jgi:polysaccharide deacetylase family protein (PEP-CTERM system associated)
MNSTLPTILLTFDVEDWFQVENLRSHFPPATWNRQELRVEKNTHKLLDLLDSITLRSLRPTTPKATFFVLGWIAKRLPNLVREIQARGHEIASHGYNHIMCNQLDPNGLEQDLVQGKKTIEDIIGIEVSGYRAPNFSIDNTAINLIRKSGYSYDSSYNNFSKHGRYGVISLDGYHTTGAAINFSQNFIELPISNLTIGNQVIPWGGGGYFRFFPLSIFKAGIRRILKKTGVYVFYLHPWEVDPEQPRIKERNYMSSWRHYLNLDKTHQRLQALITTLNHCRFLTCTQYLNTVIKQPTSMERNADSNI